MAVGLHRGELGLLALVLAALNTLMLPMIQSALQGISELLAPWSILLGQQWTHSLIKAALLAVCWLFAIFIVPPSLVCLYLCRRPDRHGVGY